MSFFFLSYHEQDAYFAENIFMPKLKTSGFPEWKNNEDALRDPQMTNGINSAINRSCGFVLIVSEASMKSVSVKFEWGYAHYINKPILPVMIESPEMIGSDGKLRVNFKVHEKLARETWFNFSDPAHYEWDKLKHKLSKLALVDKNPLATVTMPLQALNY